MTRVTRDPGDPWVVGKAMETSRKDWRAHHPKYGFGDWINMDQYGLIWIYKCINYVLFYELTRQNQDDQTLELHDPTNGGFAMIKWRLKRPSYVNFGYTQSNNRN